MLLMCERTVLAEMTNTSAISVLDRSLTRRRSTSSSRSLNGSMIADFGISLFRGLRIAERRSHVARYMVTVVHPAGESVKWSFAGDYPQVSSSAVVPRTVGDSATVA